MTHILKGRWNSRDSRLVMAVALASLALLVLPATGDAGVSSGQWPFEQQPSQPTPELVVRPVAPGIEQVLADSTGRRMDRGRVREVEVGSDGRIWAAVGSRVIELGRPGSISPRAREWRAFPRRLSDTSRGDLWAIEDGGRVVTLEGGRWIDRSDRIQSPVGAIGIGADGTTWRIGRSVNGSPIILSLDGGEWRSWPIEGLDGLLRSGQARYSLTSTTDGHVWLGVDGGARPGGLASLEGDTWRVSGPSDTWPRLQVLALAAGREADLWAVADVNPRPLARPAHYVLLHHGASGWTIYGAEEGMVQDEAQGWSGWSPLSPAAMAVDLDGRVWFSVEGTGLVIFDGSSFERIDVRGLRGGALDLDIAGDGSVWIVGAGGGLFRVEPDEIDG